MENLKIVLKDKQIKKGRVLGIDPSVDQSGFSLVDMSGLNYRVIDGSVQINKPASTAKDRRGYRRQRRNIEHTQARLNTFLNIVYPFVKDEDINFKNKIKYSDKKGVNAVFVPKRYPTINHMIMDMIYGDATFSKAEYCTALYYLNKHRGYFYGDQSAMRISTVKDTVEALNAYYQIVGKEIVIDTSVVESIIEMGFIKAGKKNKEVGEKKKEDILKMTDKDSADFYISLLSKKINKDNPFFISEMQNTISLNGMTDEKVEEFKSTYSTEDGLILDFIMDVFNTLCISFFLGEGRYICEYKVDKYDDFKNHTVQLKEAYREYATSDAYRTMFKDKSKVNFNMLINNSLGQKTGEFKKNFEKKLKDDLKTLKDIDEERYNMLCSISYYTKPASADIDVKFPHNLRKCEFVAVLDKLCETYPEFRTSRYDEYPEYTVEEAIVKNYDFQVDYYVGPLNPDNENAWIKFKDKPCKVNPFNYEHVIDFVATSEAWMNTLIGKCSVLPNYKVTPKNTFAYAKFSVLNQLNCLKINGNLISVEVKQAIFNDLFLNSSKNFTVKRLIGYLQKTFNMDENIVISGIVNSIKNPFISINKVICTLNEENRSEEIINRVIFTLTAMQDKNSRIYGLSNIDELSQEEIERLSIFSFDGWGKLSEEFLLNTYSHETGMNVLDTMYYENITLAGIKANNGFREAIAEKNPVRELPEILDIVPVVTEYCKKACYNPAVTSGVIFNFKNIARLINKTGKFPEYIAVESTRVGDFDAKDPVTKKDELLKIYKEAKLNKIEPDLYKELKNVKADVLSSRKNYLFFLQLGYDGYTGEKIAKSFKEFLLIDENSYNKDHIIPQCILIDNVLEDNLILVNSSDNQNVKGDLYPLPASLQTPKNKAVWKMLHEYKLMSDEKYARLIRTDELTLSEVRGFSDSQLANTSQVAHAIKDICEKYNIAKVLFVSPMYAAKFRQEYKFPKLRDISHRHHFEDATLTAFLGYLYKQEYDKEWLLDNYKSVSDHKKNTKNKKWNASKIFEKNISSISGELLYDINVSPERIKKLASKNVKVYQKPYVGDGELFDATIYPKHKKFGDEYSVCAAGHGNVLGESGYYAMAKIAGLLELETTDKKGVKHINYFKVRVMEYSKYQKNKHFFDERLSESYPYGFAIKRFCPIGTVLFLDAEKKYPVRYTGVSGNTICFKHVYEIKRGQDISEELFSFINSVLKIRNKYEFKSGYNYKKIKEDFEKKKIFYNEDIITESNAIKLFDDFVEIFSTDYFRKLNIATDNKKIKATDLVEPETRDNFVKMSLEEKIVFLFKNVIWLYTNGTGGKAICYEI